MMVQPRDRAVLHALYNYRHLTSDQIHALEFHGVSRTMPMRRLRLLWQHQLVDRHFMPYVLDGTNPQPRLANRPVYGLARRGACVVADDLGLELAQVEQGPVPWTNIEHNLAAADFLVAAIAAARTRLDVEIEKVQPEPALWRTLTPWRREAGLKGRSFIVPDGALTLSYPNLTTERTFYIEVVRAGVRSGNKTLLAKMRKYAELHHKRFFREVYGHDPLRAVLIATTSPERAERFREYAMTLPHGRRLFWFGCYETKDTRGRPMSDFSTDTIFSPMWTDTDGELHSLIPPQATLPSAAIEGG